MQVANKDSYKTLLLSMEKMIVTQNGTEREYHSYIPEKDISISCNGPHKNTNTMRLHSSYERTITDVIPKWVFENRKNPAILLFYNEYEFACKYCKQYAYPEVPYFGRYSKTSKRFDAYIVNLAMKYPFSKISRDLEHIVSDETINKIFRNWIQQYECNECLHYEANFEMALLGIKIAGEECSVLLGIDEYGKEDRIFNIFKNSDISDLVSTMNRIDHRENTGVFWIDHNSPFYNSIKSFFPNARIYISEQRYLQLVSKFILTELGIDGLKKPSYNLIFSDYTSLSKGRRKKLRDLENSNSLYKTARDMFVNAKIVLETIQCWDDADAIKRKYCNDSHFSSFLEKEIFPNYSIFRNAERKRSLSRDTLNQYNYITNSVNHVVNKNCKFEAIRGRILYGEESLEDYRREIARHYILKNTTNDASPLVFKYIPAHIYHWELSPQYLYKYTSKVSGLNYYKGVPIWVVAENLKRIERKGIRQHQFFWDMSNGTNHSYHSGAYLVSDYE